jgi:hypothetical protein
MSYNHLVNGEDNKSIINGPEFKDIDGTYIEFKIGPNPSASDNEFCIEDSCNRFIPIRWQNLGELILMLDELLVEHLKEVIEYDEEELI